MASVTQCDVCGNVCKNDTKGFKVASKEICEKCYNDLKKLLKMEDKK